MARAKGGDQVRLPSLEVLPPGQVSCPKCGGEIRVPGFCADCHDGKEDPFALLHYDAGDEFWRPKKEGK